MSILNGGNMANNAQSLAAEGVVERGRFVVFIVLPTFIYIYIRV